MNKKIDFELGAIQETLLLPLTARVMESKKRNGIINDPKSLEVARNINFNYRELGRRMSEFGVFGLAARAYKFDIIIQDFLKEHPKGKILTLGAGLDTSYYRCDNGEALWFDLDLDDSLNLRQQLLPPPNERVTYIKKSLFDISWMDDVGSAENGLLILVPGVFPYLEEKDIKNLIKISAKKLTGAKMVFDAVSHFGAFVIGQLIYASGMKDAHLRWKILEAKDIEKWSPNISVTSEPFFKDISKLEGISITNRQLIRLNDLLLISQIIRLEFK